MSPPQLNRQHRGDLKQWQRQRLLEGAARLLGWHGRLIEVKVLDLRVHVVGELDVAEHNRRVAESRPPVVDPLLLRCLLAENPEFAARPAPVRVAGALAAAQRWQSALRPLGGFVAFGPRAAVVPAAQACSSRLAMVALVHGFGVIAHDPAPFHAATADLTFDEEVQHEQRRTCRLAIVHHPDLQRPTHRTWVHRLVEEVVYGAFMQSAPTTCRSATP